MTEVRRPRLLTASSGEETRLNPSYLSVQLSLWPLSTAKMSLPDGEPSIRVRDQVELFGLGGSLGFFRASNVSTIYGESQEIDLEHTIASLDDDLTPKETKLTGSIRSILQQILSYQSSPLWKLGDVEITGGEYELEVDRTTLREAFVEAVKLVDNYGMFTEQSGGNWKIHIRALPAEPSCECRLTRNADSVQINVDDHELCTRVYADELPGGQMEANTDEWGVVSQVLNIPPGASADQAAAYARAYLKQYKSPAVAIRISAISLATLTGEKWDTFSLGGMCRVALPMWNTTQEKRIVTMDYPDILRTPDMLWLNLEKPERRIEEITAQTSRSGGRAARSAAEAEKNIAIVGDTIGLFANSLDGALVRLSKAESTIELKVNKADVIASINMSPEEIVISARRINLSGYVTADEISAWGGSISATELEGAIVRAASLWLNGVHVVTRNVTGDDGNVYRALVLSPTGT